MSEIFIDVTLADADGDIIIVDMEVGTKVRGKPWPELSAVETRPRTYRTEMRDHVFCKTRAVSAELSLVCSCSCLVSSRNTLCKITQAVQRCSYFGEYLSRWGRRTAYVQSASRQLSVSKGSAYSHLAPNHSRPRKT